MFYIIILLVVLLVHPGRISVFNSELIVLLTFLYMSSVVYFLIQQRKHTKNWIRFDVLFLIGYSIVHFQLPLFGAIGIDPHHPYLHFDRGLVNYATWMSTTAIVLWMLGYTIIINRKTKKIYRKNKNINFNFRINYRIMDNLLLLLFLGFIGVVGRAFLSGEYSGTTNWEEGSHQINLLFTTLLFLRIIYFFKDFTPQTSLKTIINKALKYQVFSGVLITYTLLFLFVGSRAPLLRIMFVIMGSYVLFIRPIGFRKLLFFIFIGAFVFTLIGLGRGRDASEFENTNIFERGYAQYQENKDDITLTGELSGSVRVQYYALHYVPDKHPYLYGHTYIRRVIDLIPFSHKITEDVFHWPSMYRASSIFLNILVQGPNYTSGIGGEILGDMYVNFGPYGVYVIMFFFGILMANLYVNAFNFNFKYVLIYSVLLYNAIYWSRAYFLIPLKDVVYLLVLHYLFTKIIK